MLATQVSYWTNVENERSHRANEALKARELEILNRNADINEENAATNKYNAGVNLMNAETNRLMYGVNAANAATNAKNAATQAFNAAVGAAEKLGTTDIEGWIAEGHKGTVGATEQRAETDWQNYVLDNNKFLFIDKPKADAQIRQIGKEMDLTDEQIAKVQAETAKLNKETKYLGAREVSNIVKNYADSVAKITGSVSDAFRIITSLKGGGQ